jgi:hypothetical protein
MRTYPREARLLRDPSAGGSLSNPLQPFCSHPLIRNKKAQHSWALMAEEEGLLVRACMRTCPREARLLRDPSAGGSLSNPLQPFCSHPLIRNKKAQHSWALMAEEEVNECSAYATLSQYLRSGYKTCSPVCSPLFLTV